MRSVLLSALLPAALLMSGCIADPDPAVTSANSPTSSSRRAAGTDGVPTTSAPLETTQSSNKAPVYWIGRSNSNVFLYREFRDVPDDENPITRALRAMMSETPLDPDFFTPWQSPKNLATSISGTNVITVDVSADAFNSNLDADMAQRAIQQLVYTATAAGASSGLIDAGQQIEVARFLGFCHGVKKSGSSGVSDIMARRARVMGFSSSGTSRNSRYRNTLLLLRPIQ
jgi:hypothetical protein